MSKYYYLVAGLPELTLEDSKLSYKVAGTISCLVGR